MHTPSSLILDTHCMKKWSFAAVPVPLSCPPPGSQSPLELLLMILVSGFLHFVAPRLLCPFNPLQLKEASVGMLHCMASVWAPCPAVKAHPQRERKPPLLPPQWPLHRVPLPTTFKHSAPSGIWPSLPPVSCRHQSSANKLYVGTTRATDMRNELQSCSCPIRESHFIRFFPLLS